MTTQELNCMMHPDTQLGFVNDVVGAGVFATQFIPKGTIVWILDDLDQRLDKSYVDSLDPLRQQEVIRYGYRNCHGNYILCWDLGRFMNHSNSPNVVDLAYEFEVASRDIYPGEQLTCDYGCLNIESPFECLPEVGSDRTIIYPDDLLRFANHYDAIAQDAMQFFNQVSQPLAHLVDPVYAEKIQEIATGRSVTDSIIKTYYSASKVQSNVPALV
jgi:uncharacterized protein